jgi:hypothetical protein
MDSKMHNRFNSDKNIFKADAPILYQSIDKRKPGEDQLEDLYDEIDATQEKLDVVNETFNVKYEELKKACSQAQKLQDYADPQSEEWLKRLY